MRALDIHTTAAIDERRRMVLITGAIDRSDYTITMNVPVPTAGDWTVVKAETNLTDAPWGLWLMVLGEHVSVPTIDGAPELLMSRNFENARYIPDKNVVVFFGGKGVRPGETVLKFYKLHTTIPRLTFSHGSRMKPDDPRFPDSITGRYCGEDRPRIEMTPVVQKVGLSEIFQYTAAAES